MDAVQVFGFRERPERYFLRTAGGSRLVIDQRGWMSSGFNLDPNLFYGSRAYQLFFQDGMLHLAVHLDEEQMIMVQLATVPNCAAIHNWISQANQLFARR